VNTVFPWLPWPSSIVRPSNRCANHPYPGNERAIAVTGGLEWPVPTSNTACAASRGPIRRRPSIRAPPHAAIPRSAVVSVFLICLHDVNVGTFVGINVQHLQIGGGIIKVKNVRRFRKVKEGIAINAKKDEKARLWL
jgi:hypothetical protein